MNDASPSTVILKPAALNQHFDFDVTIVGAGPVGLALAGWLARRSATRELKIALIDAREPEDSIADPRAIAVSHGSRMILEPLRWPADATAIQRIHVSQRGHFGRTLIDHGEHGLPALGYVLRYGSIVHGLAEAVHATRVHWFRSTSAAAPVQEHDGVTLPIETAGVTRRLRTRILVSAEGGLFGDQRGAQKAGKREGDSATNGADKGADKPGTRDYGQTALVGTVSVSTPQPHVAWERFTPEGPIALLPMGGVRGADYALVWCCAPEEAARRAQLPDDEFLRELGAAFGGRMGRFTHIKGRASFPLGLNAVDTQVSGRVVAIGNAAQTLHPVAGQGLNLGLRDAHALADALSAEGPTTLALATFAQRRALDRRLTIGATDTLARLFTVDFAPLAIMRGLALTALEFVPPVKTALARQMMFGQRR
ncbi:2-octaprenyl-6-methoxyphenol hydroxylase [Burkholderia sp. OAS925]|uniref:Ubiquinone biosynthesis hydroxylase, UbiH/UbiF/VisC/COQ6 family n=1 Tax=Paraburkholderia graminis (strain ATCC 700544 / DSM 17151 / LMG 18924 / NCIMB 13744 / C4D1M) TaxID=396598 RepID=B1G1Z8_PARG4|nr:UbiH/UbiF/VisC/COQ6 family ubiquinone biosynthesis hydroxylase [Paraburkholderia graminis]EDT09709.1 Ubiquinone biosynthesis hydroxylase, UbiH/UbiF/VisC/COQ6 family [Paraburkholderia graminis C4D1M]MDR6472679.1 2-octaprenyl-6-methoxyphenol hydroxylase [Paraburkholderia graminis]CAB3702674.1 2-octaprenyl-6-methoxyphenol hydroxylase [Paraburkholderia graminis C4D1M]